MFCWFYGVVETGPVLPVICVDVCSCMPVVVCSMCRKRLPNRLLCPRGERQKDGRVRLLDFRRKITALSLTLSPSCLRILPLGLDGASPQSPAAASSVRRTDTPLALNLLFVLSFFCCVLFVCSSCSFLQLLLAVFLPQNRTGWIRRCDFRHSARWVLNDCRCRWG